ncbi:NYN domain protein [compost metagenome]
MEGWGLKKRFLAKHAGEGTVSVGAADLRPVVKQKGVDMRIGLDIASLTLKKHVSMIVLATGDSDFVPAMKFARREGAQVMLIVQRKGIKEPLREHADIVIDDL